MPIPGLSGKYSKLGPTKKQLDGMLQSEGDVVEILVSFRIRRVVNRIFSTDKCVISLAKQNRILIFSIVIPCAKVAVEKCEYRK